MPYIPLFYRNPSTKPTYVDLGNGEKENDPVYPPAPQHPEADEYNEMGGAIEGLSIMTDIALIRVTNSAGVYTKVAGKAINKNFDLATNVNITKNGTGDLTYTFTAGIIPPITGAHVQHNHTTANTRSADVEIVSGTTIRVRTWNAGSASEANYTLFIK